MAVLLPIITFDGPSGSGKGTISQAVADKLGWHWLESGALYRAVAWAALERGLAPDQLDALIMMMSKLEIELLPAQGSIERQVVCQGQQINELIRSEACAAMASKLAALPVMRAALMQQQREMLKPPGLVCDGRDMGTVVFPGACQKFYLTASLAARAQRRFQQLKNAGTHGTLSSIESELLERDSRDNQRAVSPAMPADDALIIDTTALTIAQVLEKVWSQLSLLKGIVSH